MLTHIPTHIITGPLGAGKTTLIGHLLAQKPATERWAVLINEFGQIGLDQALLSTDQAGVGFAEVAGGCLCCVNGVPFQVALGRLLRRVKPHRLLIEPSGLGHPLALLKQLQSAPWQSVLELQPLLMLLDAPALAAGQPLPDSQASCLSQAGLLLLNKAEQLDTQGRQHLAERFAEYPMRFCSHAQVAVAEIPGMAAPQLEAFPEWPVLEAEAPMTMLGPSPQQPICIWQQQADAWSIGWRWHRSIRFDLGALAQFLQTLSYQRAKAVVHHAQGCSALNALAQQPLQWQPSVWHQDSRLELIFAESQPVEILQLALQACIAA